MADATHPDDKALSGSLREALQALLAREEALRRAVAEAARALEADPGAGAAALAALAAVSRDDGATAPLVALHGDAQAHGHEALARELEELLRGRGVQAFPRDVEQARADLAAEAEGYEVARVDAPDAPRGAVVRVTRRGLRDGAGVVALARVEVSRGPRDPLEAALADLEDVLARTPVPAGSPALDVRALREAMAQGQAPDPAALAVTLSAADALDDQVVDLTLEDVYRLLGATGIEPVPPAGATALGPGAPRDGVELADAPAPAGTLLAVRRRGFVRRAAASVEVLLPPAVVVSRGPRPALHALLERVAAGPAPVAPLAALSADLLARVDRAREAEALGGGAPLRRDALVAAALDLVRALERLGDALGAGERRAELDAFVAREVLPALAGLDPEVEPLPPPGATALDDLGLYEVEETFDAAAPRGALLAVRRLGLVDRRGGLRKVHPARVVLSRGAKSPLEHALERIEALEAAAPEVCAALRTAWRRAADAQGMGATPDPHQVADAAAALLDAVEERALAEDGVGRELTLVLDGALREALRRVGVEVALEGPALGARRAFSARPAGERLGVARRALLIGARPRRKGEVLLSLGPRWPLLLAADGLEELLPRADLPADVAEALRARIGLERAVEADLLAGRQALGAGSPRDRALALLDALDRARAAAPAERAALDAVVDGPLEAALVAEGLRLFPRGAEPLDPALLAREGAFASFEARPSREPRGRPLEVLAHGVVEAREGGEVRRPARVALSLGFDASFDEAVAEALRALPGDQRLPALAARLRDPRAQVDEGEALDVVFAAHRAAAGEEARAPLARVLAALGAEVFPRPGARWDDGAPGEVRRVFSDDAPAGQVLAVLEPGLRKAGAVLRRPVVEVSRGRPSALQRALGEAAEALRRAGAVVDPTQRGPHPADSTPRSPGPAPDPLLQALEAGLARVDELAEAEQSALLVDLLGKLEDAGKLEATGPLAAALLARGHRVLPEQEGGRWEDLLAGGAEAAFDPPRRVLVEAAQGTVVAVERRAVVGPGGVLRKGRVRVAAGPPTELSRLADGLRVGLAGALTGDAQAAALAELDEVVERITNAHAERGYLLALPLMNLLQKHDLREKLGGELKEHMRRQGLKEIIAYPNYDANRLGVSKLEEVRVRSDRPKGKIVRVLRPGFERTSDGAVLQKVRAEVSR